MNKLIYKMDNEKYSIDRMINVLYSKNIDEKQAETMLCNIVTSRIERIRNVIYSYLEWLLYNSYEDIRDYIFDEDVIIVRRILYGNKYNNSLLKDLIKYKDNIMDLGEEVYKFDLEKEEIYSLEI